MKPEPLEIICFHCQQAAEKALKAYLVFLEIRVPKTHDLDYLLELCETSEPIRNLRTITIPLNDYSVITLYPFYQRIDIAVRCWYEPAVFRSFRLGISPPAAQVFPGYQFSASPV